MSQVINNFLDKLSTSAHWLYFRSIQDYKFLRSFGIFVGIRIRFVPSFLHHYFRIQLFQFCSACCLIYLAFPSNHKLVGISVFLFDSQGYSLEEKKTLHFSGFFKEAAKLDVCNLPFVFPKSLYSVLVSCSNAFIYTSSFKCLCMPNSIKFLHLCSRILPFLSPQMLSWGGNH